MAGTAVFSATTHGLHLDIEPAVSQALLKFPILSSRPNRQRAIRL
jgi:hypothetical protein